MDFFVIVPLPYFLFETFSHCQLYLHHVSPQSSLSTCSPILSICLPIKVVFMYAKNDARKFKNQTKYNTFELWSSPNILLRLSSSPGSRTGWRTACFGIKQIKKTRWVFYPTRESELTFYLWSLDQLNSEVQSWPTMLRLLRQAKTKPTR